MVNSPIEKVNSESKLSGGLLSNLTDSEKEVLHMITEENATPKEITLRRKTKKGITYKLIRSLKEKGALTISKQMVNSMVTSSSPNGQIRLHAQEFNIKPIVISDRYRTLLKEWNGKGKIIDNNTVRLFPHAIEVNSGHDFYSDMAEKATAKSMQYWQRFFAILENDLQCVILKPRATNITIVNAHYAEVGNEIAKNCNAKGDKIRVYCDDDFKLGFLIDGSLNFDEAETVHSKTSKADMQNVLSPWFNDGRNYYKTTGEMPPVPSQILSMIYQQARQCNEMNKNVLEIGAAFNLILKGQIQMQQSEEMPKDQRPLNDYFG